MASQSGGHCEQTALGRHVVRLCSMAAGRSDRPCHLVNFAPPTPDYRPRPAAGAHSGPRVALVHLGNTGGLGTIRRVQIWQELLEAAGAHSIEVNLLGNHRRLVPSPLTTLPALAGRVAIESAVWSVSAAERAVKAIGPDVVVFITPRAFHPRLAAVADRSILDFQDLFSRSYHGRALVDRRWGARTAWKTLAWSTARFEEREHHVATVSAGFAEAQAIGATWIPNTVSVLPAPLLSDHAAAPFDLIFFGKLSSLPNVDALRTLRSLWPRLSEEIPDLSCLIAGAGLTEEITAMAAQHGWVVEDGFGDVAELCQRARIALAPLRHANGIQNKVLEAGAAGLPQVLSPQALGGTLPGFPAMVVRTREGMVAAVRMLLAEPRRRLQLATDAHTHVAAHYTVERWAPVVASLLEGTTQPLAQSPVVRSTHTTVLASAPKSQPSEPAITSAKAMALRSSGANEPIDT